MSYAHRPPQRTDYPELVEGLPFSLRWRKKKNSPSTSSGLTGFGAGADARNQRGFTLVELLVALTIFAMVSAAGVMLLRSSIDTQMAVSKRLSEGGGVNRLRAIIGSELASAQPRPVRDQSGNPLPAFVGESGSIAFVHAADSGGVEGALGRSRYALEGGALIRQASPQVDGANPGDPAPLVREVTAARWRFRSLDGGWSEAWQPDDPARLPRAVELTLERQGAAPLVLRFLVGPDGLPPPGQEPQGEAP